MIPDPHAFAEEKLDRVFGSSRGRALLEEVLRELRKDRIESVQVMYDVGVALERRGGIEAGVGAILKVQAVLRGRDVTGG